MLLCYTIVIIIRYDSQAAWIKVETKAILTIHHHIITRNYRISLSHSDNRNFLLQIRSVQEADKGGYMCQVNTVPMKSQVGYLDVLGKGNYIECLIFCSVNTHNVLLLLLLFNYLVSELIILSTFYKT